MSVLLTASGLAVTAGTAGAMRHRVSGGHVPTVYCKYVNLKYDFSGRKLVGPGQTFRAQGANFKNNANFYVYIDVTTTKAIWDHGWCSQKYISFSTQ